MKLRFTGEWLSIDVIDNGTGFEWFGHTPGGSRHYGLIGMKERMEKLGGSFDLDSSPGQGTRVRLRVPLPQAIINDPRRTPQSV
jgi:signal transduction histidine kinase